MNVLGLDLSLNATGVAHCDGSTDTWSVGGTGAARLILQRDRLASLLEAHIDLVVIEDLPQARAHGLADLGQVQGVVRVLLHESGQPWVAIPPASMKMFATDNGNAPKDAVLAAAIRRLGYAGHSKDEADALWLRAMALQHYGDPVVEIPKNHLRGMTKVAWPVLEVAA